MVRIFSPFRFVVGVDILGDPYFSLAKLPTLTNSYSKSTDAISTDKATGTSTIYYTANGRSFKVVEQNVKLITK